MKNIELCPFCGSGNVIVLGGRAVGASAFVMCNACDAMGPHAHTPEAATALWNIRPTRPTSPRTVSRIVCTVDPK